MFLSLAAAAVNADEAGNCILGMDSHMNFLNHPLFAIGFAVSGPLNISEKA